jgi:hypothetical protein
MTSDALCEDLVHVALVFFFRRYDPEYVCVEHVHMEFLIVDDVVLVKNPMLAALV